MNEEEDYEDARHDVLFRSSGDGGETWSDRVIINDVDAEVNQFDPGIAIAPNGRVDVVWYDFRESPTPPADVSGQGGEEGYAHIYYSASHDEGETFSPNMRVSDRMIDRSVGVWSNNVDSKHNIGITSTDTSAYVAWQDTRNADPELQAEDIYTAAVHTGAHLDQAQASPFVHRLQGAAVALLAVGLLLLFAGLLRSRQRAG